MATPWGSILQLGNQMSENLGDQANALTNIYNSYWQGKQIDKLNKNLEKQYNEGKLTLQEYKDAIGAANADYSKALSEADFESAGKIDFDKDSYNRDDFRKSNEAEIKQGAADTAMAQNIGSGSSWGTGAQGNILSAIVKQQEDLDAYADQKMNEQRTFDYNYAKDEASQRLNALTNKLNALGQQANLNKEGLDSYYGGILELNNTKNQNKNNLSMYKIQNQTGNILGQAAAVHNAGF